MGESRDDWGTAAQERQAYREAMDLADKVPLAWQGLAIGRMIRRMRKELGLHQWQLAMRLEMRQSMISRIERGADLRVGTLRRIFQALGCELAILPVTDRGLEGLRKFNRLYEAQQRAEGRKALADMIAELKSKN